MKANIVSAIEQISDTVADGGDSAVHATSLEKLLVVIEGAGAIKMEGEPARTLLTLNEATEISAIDARMTRLKLQRAADATSAGTAEGGDGAAAAHRTWDIEVTGPTLCVHCEM